MQVIVEQLETDAIGFIGSQWSGTSGDLIWDESGGAAGPLYNKLF